MTTETKGIRTDRNAYILAGMAECSTPDNHESPGAEFLRVVIDSLAERVAWNSAHDEAEDLTDIVNETADGLVPIYTYEMWKTFLDLGAYDQDITELVDASADMDQEARLALYVIAERLCRAVITEDTDNDAI